MAKNTSKRKATNLLEQKKVSREVVLPFNGALVKQSGFSFSFSCFDRKHELFNLGGKENDGTVGGKWFIRLLDRLKDASGKTITELKNSLFDLHPVDWATANTNCPTKIEQAEYWQFRVDKSHGRVIGILIGTIFYVVWLDPYHNLTDSDGYGGVNKFPAPK